jgi:SAM-dependent methyltransferase
MGKTVLVGFLERVRAQRRLRIKSEAELSYWRGRRDSEHGTLGRPLGAESLFCDRFGLDRGFYEGKRVLDIGCGPRGSLEWADMAAERIGIDPLVPEYRELGIEQHAMSYVTGAAERMPFEAGRFDVISTLNSLDHVDDLEAAVDELTRVAASGATWLVVVEADAAPTATEPQTIPWNLLDGLEGWRVETIQRFALDADHDIYGSWGRGVEWVEGPGLLVARLTRL